MIGNETPNEKNHRLLKQRFTNENETDSKVQIEIDFGNEPVEMKLICGNGNEKSFKVERITGNETGLVLHCRNENETGSGNENENGNEL